MKGKAHMMAVAGASGAVLLALALLAAGHVASARDFVWKEGRCNTNFNNDANWDAGAPKLEDTNVKTTVYFGPKDGPSGDWDPVSSLVQAGDYGMSEIVFSGDGTLEFQADGPELVFYPPGDTTGDTTAFTAAQGYSPECDFNCHKNWEVDGNATTTPPCATDVAHFPMGWSYRVLVNTFSPLAALHLDGARYTTEAQEANIPNLFMSPSYDSGNNGLFLDGDEPMERRAECAAYARYSAKDDACVCFSTCPSTEQQLEDEARLVELVAAALNSSLAAALNRTSKQVTYTFHPVQLLGLDPLSGLLHPYTAALLAMSDHVPTIHAVVNQTQAELGATLNDATLSANKTSLTFDNTTGILTLTSVLHGPRIVLDGINAGGHYAASAPGSGSALLAHYVWKVASAHALQMAKDMCEVQHSALQCSRLTEIGAAITQSSNTFTLVPATSSFEFGALLPRSMQVRLLQGYTAASVSAFLCQLLEDVPPFVECDNVILSQPERRRRRRRRRRFGGQASDPLMAAVTYKRFRDNDCTANDQRSECRLASGSPRFSELETLLNSAMATFEPTEPTCLSFDTGIDRDCTVQEGYTAVLDALMQDTPAPRSQWEAVVQQTFYASIGGCGLRCTADGGFSDAAYEAQIATMFASVYADVEAMVLAWLATSSTTVPTTASTTTAASSSTTTFALSSSTTSDAPFANPKATGSSELPSSAIIAIGTVGGIVVLAALVFGVVFLRARGCYPQVTPAGQAHADDGKSGARPVVSFSNPMYQEEEGSATVNAVYEPMEGEGMYDQPSVSNTRKQNPMFDSREDLAAGGEEPNLKDDGAEEEQQVQQEEQADAEQDDNYLDVEGEASPIDDANQDSAEQ